MYNSFDVQQAILHSEFDIETHKNTFINYLEVIIDVNGIVHYAVPSHQECLIHTIMEKYYLTRQSVIEQYTSCRDFMEQLCKDAECIAVWNNYYIGTPNQAQINTLTELSKNWLYSGTIPTLYSSTSQENNE